MRPRTRPAQFKTSPRHWVSIFSLLLLTVALPVFWCIQAGARTAWPGVIIAAGGAVLCALEMRKAAIARVMFTPEGVFARLEGTTFHIRWKEVRAVTITRTGVERGITFYLPEGSEFLPGRYFDYSRLLTVVQQNLPLQVQDPLAYRQLKEYRAWQSAIAQKYGAGDFTYSADLGLWQRIASALLLGTGIFTFWKGHPAALYLLTAGFFLLLDSFQSLKVTPQSICRTSIFGQTAIGWDDIQKIYYSPEAHVYVLQSAQTRLTLSNPVTWSGKDKKALVEFVHYRIHTSPTIPLENEWVVFWRSRRLAKKPGRRPASR